MRHVLPIIFTLFLGFGSTAAHALDLDWSGQFRAEAHWVTDYQMENSTGRDVGRYQKGGYYIPGGGSDEAHFQTLFMKLKPKVIVNDNIYLKSEWWVGDPVYGLFGNATPYPADQRQYYSTQTRGSTIQASRFWGELMSDVGTFQVGRAPMHYGLGIVWNSGDQVWDRYQSTGDMIRLVGKFGSFSFVPSVIKYSMGNNIGGSCSYNSVTGLCDPTAGGGGVSDYSLMIKYENPDEEMEGGVNFIKRIAGPGQDPAAGYRGITQPGATPASSGMNFNTWDLYLRKKLGKLSIAGELPLTSGDIAGLEYKTFAVALETKYAPNDTWDFFVKGGHAPGQPNLNTATASKYRAFYFHHNYKIALIMFNYQLANFAGPNSVNNPNQSQASLASPFDNQITNANYINWGGAFNTEKWVFRTNWALASARESAEKNQAFFNSWEKRYYTNVPNTSQDTSLGWEMDYGTTFKWDDALQFMFDFGWYFPGDYYKFSNAANPNNVSSVFASVFKVGVNF